MIPARGRVAPILCWLLFGAMPYHTALAGPPDGSRARTQSTPRSAIPVSSANAARLRSLLAGRAAHAVPPRGRPAPRPRQLQAPLPSKPVAIKHAPPASPLNVRAGAAPRSRQAASVGGPQAAGGRASRVAVLDGGRVRRNHD